MSSQPWVISGRSPQGNIYIFNNLIEYEFYWILTACQGNTFQCYCDRENWSSSKKLVSKCIYSSMRSRCTKIVFEIIRNALPPLNACQSHVPFLRCIILSKINHKHFSLNKFDWKRTCQQKYNWQFSPFWQ